jgi:hypothetical protein
VRYVSFKERDEVTLPGSKLLCTPATALLVFRYPAMWEQGNEMVLPPAEAYAQLLQRGTVVCTLAVVDEDAVRRPCFVASGFWVRFFFSEEDQAPKLRKGRVAHGATKVLNTFRRRMRDSDGRGAAKCQDENCGSLGNSTSAEKNVSNASHCGSSPPQRNDKT